MPIVNTKQLLSNAQIGKYAIPAFNIHNIETLQAIIEAAEEENAPVIIQTTPGTIKHVGIGYLTAIVKSAAINTKIPVALHLDHCEDFNLMMRCLRHGYTSLMVDGSKLSLDENAALVKKVSEIAKCMDVNIEGELGKISGTEDDIYLRESEACFTVPEEAALFVERSGVDSLAVAIGTAHGVYNGEPKIDFARLSKIRSAVDVPLVLHGASGVPDEAILEAVSRGICKVNIATELKIPMADEIKKVFKANPEESDPRIYMGKVKSALKSVIKHKIRICSCNGKAEEAMRCC